MYEANQVSRGGLNGPSLINRGPSTMDAERVMLLDDITRRVQGSNERISDQIIAVRDIADSLLGGVPQASGKDAAGQPLPSGRAYGLGIVTNTTDELITLLREQVDRLRTL